jgi:hypothetical protein
MQTLPFAGASLRSHLDEHYSPEISEIPVLMRPTRPRFQRIRGLVFASYGSAGPHEALAGTVVLREKSRKFWDEG